MSRNDRKKTIRERLIAFLSGPEGDDAHDTLGPPDDRLKTTVGDVIREHGSASLGRLQMLNLEELIIHRQNRDELLRKADEIVAGVAAEHLSEDDRYLRYGHGVYGFIFPGRGKESAAMRCAVIADDLVRRLIEAHSAFEGLEVARKVQHVTERSRAASSGQRSEAPGAVGPQPDASGESDQGDTADADVSRGGRRAAPPQPAKSRDSQRDFDGLSAAEKMRLYRENRALTRVGSKALDRMVRSAPGDGDAPPGGLGRVDWAANADASAMPESFSVVYHPIWNVRNRVLSAYRAEPVLVGPDRSVMRVDDFIGRGDSYRMLAVLDGLVLDEAARNLGGLLDRGERIVMVLPVRFTTIDHYASFAEYTRQLDELDADRAKHVVLEIVDPPPDLMTMQGRGAVSRLGERARTTMVRVPLDTRQFGKWLDARVHAIGFDRQRQRLEERKLISSMAKFAERADAIGLKTFAYGLDSLSLVTAAVFEGITYAEGPAIRPAMTQPEYMERYAARDLLAEVLPA